MSAAAESKPASGAAPRIVVALDFAEAAPALALAARLDPESCALKVGKELFTAAGPDVVRELQRRGYRVFLDLKFHDIPNTVASACAAATRLGVWMLNVHASGGAAMMRAAHEATRSAARDGAGTAPLLVAVTVLTSLGAADLAAIGIDSTPEAQVLRLAKLTQECGLDGVVCSALETAALRAQCGPGFTLVTPGIRPVDGQQHDQVRIATPESAIAAGSDYLVIGRAITGAPDPLSALRAIARSIEARA